MQNRIVRIDQRLSRAICAEVAARLRIVLTKELTGAPGFSEQPNRPPTGFGSIVQNRAFQAGTPVMEPSKNSVHLWAWVLHYHGVCL
jgi:hypothetical protein